MPDPPPFAHAHLCGWLDLPIRHKVAATMPTLIQAGPALVADPGKTVLLYKCWTDVFSGLPDYPPQEIGDCVSFGHGHALDLLQTIAAFLGHRDAGSIHRTCTEFIYGSSRDVAGILGNQDGSFGSAAVKAMTTVGIVPYSSVPGPYDGDRAKEWGRLGPPPELEAEAARWKLGAGALLHEAEEMMAALQAGHPCTICTARGFTTQRDAHGFCRLQGRWGHCMWVAGYRASPPGYCVCQSWGPDQPTGPLDLDQPSWSFWVHPADMDMIIAEGDSYALSESPTFEPQVLPVAWQTSG